MYNIYERLRDERGLKNSDVAKATGLNATFFSEWKKGKVKNPSITNLKKIANFFGVSVEVLTGERESNVPTLALSDEYVELIDLYSKLSEEGKNSIIYMLKNIK